jgi:molybdenum cofactor synthesis domain-containing protein
VNSERATQNGSVVSVNVSLAQGTTKEPVPEIVVDGRGIVGDAHAGEWHRQASLLAVESIERFSTATGRQFRYGEFAENITTRGVDLLKAAVLDRLSIGDVELEVTQLGKACHEKGCAIYQTIGKCIMPTEGIFGRVIKGGTVRPGDAITLASRPLRFLLITLSDRASRGIYEDRSGPRIRECLEDFFRDKRWRLELDARLLSDDAEWLRRELGAARDGGVDVVFTTGGTGIGPRDVTPEVVTGMADKLIPGVMEHIRLKFGAEKPNALLSRSVAGVMRQTLVYALPGSVKAVSEYMGEILKTLEHSLLMLHGLDAH